MGIKPFTTDVFKGFLSISARYGYVSGRKLQDFIKVDGLPYFCNCYPLINGCIVALCSTHN
jgi:hypothetical protein